MPLRIKRIIALLVCVFITLPAVGLMVEDICSEHEFGDIVGCTATFSTYVKASMVSNRAGGNFSGSNGQPRNYRKAMELYKISAAYNWDETKGDQFYIAMMYAKGWGVKKDLMKAINWYTKSAELGAKSSQNNLGMLYYWEDSIRDIVLADMWVSIAVRSGQESSKKAKERVEKNMTYEELEESKKLTDSWLAAHPLKKRESHVFWDMIYPPPAAIK